MAAHSSRNTPVQDAEGWRQMYAKVGRLRSKVMEKGYGGCYEVIVCYEGLIVIVCYGMLSMDTVCYSVLWRVIVCYGWF